MIMVGTATNTMAALISGHSASLYSTKISKIVKLGTTLLILESEDPTISQDCITSHNAILFLVKRDFFSSTIQYGKTAVCKLLLLRFTQSTLLQVFFPRSAKRRIGDTKVKSFTSMTITRNGAIECDILSSFHPILILE